MNSSKKGEGVSLLKFEGGPGVSLLNFRGVLSPMGNRFSLFRSNSREKLKAKFDDDCLGAKVKQVYSIPVELFTSIGKKKYEAFSNLLKTLHEEKNA